ncbi:MAG: phenylalanine--tRNA ligase subunit beta [Chloroflexi bacterium]|nr:phenylalanine--tRNA ligase subunit beta [Chloroflexota bacterium]MYK62418.1 phenylalanine--tRNA ligase subunit beta [Chloroflexota bacterium]
MKVPLSWLREYVDVNIDVDELAHRLTMAGNEVDSIERFGHIENVVVGEVLHVSPHPNADRLRLVQVDDGDGVHEVVCGAPNVTEGQKIAYASIGAELFDAYSDEPGKTRKLRRSKIRGVESSGMVCSEKELGIGDDHDGILVLPKSSVIGTPIGDVLGDAVLDIELTPNRPDCLGVVGVARDVAALTGESLRMPTLEYEAGGPEVETLSKVTVVDGDLSPRYLGAVISGVKIGPSPSWLQERLLAIGERPINNIVDATNFVMFELGQPLHAFDYDKVADHHVIVRRAMKGEHLTTLDGVERKLDGDSLLISDPSGGIGLAGIMGGENTEISDTTVNIFLESANFNPQNNRRTAGMLGMRSEATLRFEKGLRAGLAEVGIKRCLRIIQLVAGGEIAPGLIDEWPGKGSEQEHVDLTRRDISRVMGVDYPSELVEATLRSLSFEIGSLDSGDSGDDGWRVSIPYWRSDISIPEDLVEELARIIGYDDLPATPLSGSVPRWEPGAKHAFRQKVIDALTAYGMKQTITYVAISDELEEKAPPPAPKSNGIRTVDGIKLDNPVSGQRATLRRSLRAPTLESAARNTRTWRGPVALFESGIVFGSQERDDDDPLPSQIERVTGVMTGPRNLSIWGSSEDDFDFFDAKGAVEHVLETLGLEAKFIPLEDSTYAQGGSAEVVTNDRKGTVLGSVGVVDDAIWERFDAESSAAVMFELDVEALYSLIGEKTRADNYAPYTRYPDSQRDLALVADSEMRVGDALRICTQNRLVKSASVFDVYEGGGLEEGKKSLGIRVTYQSDARTLTSEQVTRAEDQIVMRLERELGVTLRGQ